MTKIPSIEQTDDLVVSIQSKNGEQQLEPGFPPLIVFEDLVTPLGPFHSMDVTAFRDGQRANDIEFMGFEHLINGNIAQVIFTFCDEARNAREHDYAIKVVLRYLV